MRCNGVVKRCQMSTVRKPELIHFPPNRTTVVVFLTWPDEDTRKKKTLLATLYSSHSACRILGSESREVKGLKDS